MKTTNTTSFPGAILAGAVLLLCSQAAFAQDASDESKKLAALAQNPIASAISLPLQYNYNGGYGRNNSRGGSIFNVQPVIPFSLGDDWNLVTRAIIPIVDLPVGAHRKSGLSDINFTGFLSPAKAGKWIWGIGPIMTFPTASDDFLGSEKTSMGPAFVALRMHGPWVYGGLLNNQWSIAGDDDREDVNSMLFNPFLNYNIPNSKGWYLTTGPNITANWQADSDDVWTLPVGGGVGKVFKIGTQACNAKVAYYNNVMTPDGGPEDTIQLQFTFLFPN